MKRDLIQGKGVGLMKVMDQEVIRSGEQDLIDGITADLDWTAVEQVFLDNHNLRLGEDVEYKSGDLVVHDQQVAYLLEFEVKVPLSIVLDREGNCLSIMSSNRNEPESFSRAGQDEQTGGEA
jgi:hypothetical protein